MTPSLLKHETISSLLTRDADWQWSHGAQEKYLGMGMLYYTVVYISAAKVAVCLGSGGGFVPRLMRQAQRDRSIAPESRTILIDANDSAPGWGAPAWLPEESF